jgi:hypothetical protein
LEYLLIFFVIVGCLYLGWTDKRKHIRLKRNGTKVYGTIISNREFVSGKVDFYRLGGNINTPTVKFMTQDGREIIGTPVLGFITQHEVIPPIQVIVFYNPKQPDEFCIKI